MLLVYEFEGKRKVIWIWGFWTWEHLGMVVNSDIRLLNFIFMLLDIPILWTCKKVTYLYCAYTMWCDWCQFNFKFKLYWKLSKTGVNGSEATKERTQLCQVMILRCSRSIGLHCIVLICLYHLTPCWTMEVFMLDREKMVQSWSFLYLSLDYKKK